MAHPSPPIERHGGIDSRPRAVRIDGRLSGLPRPAWRAALATARPGPMTRRRRKALRKLARYF